VSERLLPTTVLDFEKPIVELEVRVDKLRVQLSRAPELKAEVDRLEAQVDRLQRETFSRLSRWQTVQLARHAGRPTCLDYIERIFSDFIELHGDRVSGEDAALTGGLTKLDGVSVMVIAHARGRTPEEEQRRSFGMTRPSGFRKAVRLAALADRLGLPIITMIDTPGAYPGSDAEEHGQALAISGALDAFAQVGVPVVACVVGEGGSGGALALSVSDRLLMQEYAIFPVISPEACSSILYRDGLHAEQMSEALKLTAKDLVSFGLVDELVPEPAGGAHRDPARAAELLKQAMAGALATLRPMTKEKRLAARYARLRSYGATAAI
jgi:acetyl-CoA carboxylase carboxyl transferase subunit alpha